MKHFDLLEIILSDKEYPEQSFYWHLKELGKQVNYGMIELSVDDFKELIQTKLKLIESLLQSLDAGIGEPKRYYIKEIIDQFYEYNTSNSTH